VWDQMQVFVKDLSGRNVAIEAESAATLGKFRSTVHSKTGVSPRQQRLLLGERALNRDALSLRECGVVPGSQLLLLGALRGGGDDEDDDEPLGDSDDDGEMARLRKARSYKPAVKAVPTKSSYVPPPKQPEPESKPQEVVAEDDGKMDMAAMMGFGGFGKIAEDKKKKAEIDHSKTVRAAPLILPAEPSQPAGPDKGPVKGPERGPKRKADENAGEPESEEEEEEDRDGPEGDEGQGQVGAPPTDEELGLPVSHEIHLRGHARAVTALGLDPKGARLLTGGNDHKMYMWDFNGMTSALRSFRNITPWENYPVVACPSSCTGDRFVAATGHPQLKIYNRDGLPLAILVKGDMYIHDPTKTKGHTHPLTGAAWHPHNRNIMASCSQDCTVRVFDLEEWSMHQGSGAAGKAALSNLTQGIMARDIVVLKNKQGKKQQITTMAYTPDGGTMATAGVDGSLQLYRVSDSLKRPAVKNWTAHTPDSWTSCITFSQSGQLLLSRAGDDTMKVWDIRKFEKPLQVFSDLPSYFQTTQCVFSPGEKYILTGTSCKKDEGKAGMLCFWDCQTFQPVRQIGLVPDGGVTAIKWNEHLNQLIVGGSDGTHVLYSPNASQKGAMLCVGKHVRPKEHDVTVGQAIIWNPHALPMYRADTGKRRKKDKARHDPKQTKIPQRPVSGPDGHGGIVSQQSSWLSHHLMGKLIEIDDRSQDPRDVYLSKEGTTKGAGGINPYYKKGTKDFSLSAYAKNQPKPMFDYRDPETHLLPGEEEEK